MADSLERSLTDGLTKVAAAARPPDDAWERLARRLDSHPGVRTGDATNHENKEIVVLTPRNQEPETRRVTHFVWAAAAAGLLIFVVVAFAAVSDDTAPADQPIPETSTLPDGAAPTPEVSIAERFVTALGEWNADSAMSLVAQDALIQHYGQSGSHAEIGVAVAMEHATGGRIELQGCESPAPEQVRCEATYIDDRVEAVGGVPADMIYYIRVENGMIAAYRVGLDTETFESNPWSDYQRFVSERSSDDFVAMFAGHPDGMGIVGPVLTEESVELHRQYTEKFVLDQSDGT